MIKVAIIMGSKSDIGIMQKAEAVLNEYGIKNEMYVASAHRNPEKVREIANHIEECCDVVIAGAGMAAHLPGVMASMVTKPVIGVPIDASPLHGMDALLAIVQMPPGIPVATVAVNGAKNAAILAMQIMALKDDEIKRKYSELRKAVCA
jgi:5-(carboxyamino)imidazole ribonucleotide mutase